MKKYYEDEHVTLYNGNCIEVLLQLESESVDAVITDPPYCSGGTHASARTKATSNKYLHNKGDACPFPDFDGDSKDQRSFHYWCHLWLSQAHRITKTGGVLLQFTDWRQLPITSDAIQSADFTWRGIAVWDKKNSRPRKGGLRNQCEYVVWGSKGDLKQEGICLKGCFEEAIVMGKKRFHQTQKPNKVMEKLCEIAWRANSIILDPFAGSGSTLVAAKKLGKKAIGIERSEQYAEIAAKRLSETLPNSQS